MRRCIIALSLLCLLAALPAAALPLVGVAPGQAGGVTGHVVFTCTTTNQAITGLPTPPNPNGYVTILVPLYPPGGTTPGTVPVRVNWVGGNSTTAGVTYAPGQADTYNAAVAPTCSTPTGTAIIEVTY